MALSWVTSRPSSPLRVKVYRFKDIKDKPWVAPHPKINVKALGGAPREEKGPLLGNYPVHSHPCRLSGFCGLPSLEGYHPRDFCLPGLSSWQNPSHLHTPIAKGGQQRLERCVSNPERWCCESAALNMPANWENSAVATGLEKNAQTTTQWHSSHTLVK